MDGEGGEGGGGDSFLVNNKITFWVARSGDRRLDSSRKNVIKKLVIILEKKYERFSSRFSKQAKLPIILIKSVELLQI